MRAAAMFAALMLPLAAWAHEPATCAGAGTQADINACVASDFGKADAELNRVWKLILAKYKDQPLFLEKLRASQRLWLQFRDAEVQALYPVGKGENVQAQYGSVYPMCESQAKAQLTAQRIQQLKVWLDGAQEGDVCAGSIKNSAELK